MTSTAPELAKSEMIEGFRSIFNTGKGSDLRITCGGKTFNVHKALICPRSHFFAAACWGGFKESESNCIDLPEDNPIIIGKMLQYLLFLNYDELEGSNLIWKHLEEHALVYAAGEKYGLKGLKAIATQQFASAIEDSIIDEEPFILDTFDEYASIVEIIYSTTPESDWGLRVYMVTYAKMMSKHLSKAGGFKELLARLPDFAYDIIAH